jgi:hypothetical protein
MNVEAILQQIRERVTAEQDAPVSSTARAKGAPLNGSAANSNVNESLTRASAHLAVTGRAWDRLPPVFSNRSGALARLELRIKRTCKSLTRWFTWEQVNFNREVNDALCDVIEILKIQAHELASLRAQLTNEMHPDFLELRSRFDGQSARLTETEVALARLSDALGSLADEARGGHSQLANKLNELAAALRTEQQTEKSTQGQELNRRLAELAAELREDQRVCFRQLSLESSESAILEDRGRRELLTRLEKLEGSASAKPR